MTVRAWAPALTCLLASGCTDEATPDSSPPTDAALATELIDHAAWRAVPAADDPLASHRPAETVCPEGASVVEHGALEVQTGYCNYLALAQVLPVPIEAGDMLRVVLWHDRLVADPAVGHVAILLGGEVAWERSVTIPSEASVYDELFAPPRTFEAGEAVGLHLHNHGYNSWSLLSLEKLQAAD